jgi:hypothetical protein
LVEICGLPSLNPCIEAFIGHQAVRLTYNHGGYSKLWNEQFNEEWREPKPKHSWPVLEGEDDRWAVRAAIDALVAEAYGITREQYAHVLSTFSHKSYPKTPELCLAQFDELKSIGLDAFTKKYDPYWDIPLNENLPKPVIESPVIEERKNVIREEGSPYFVDRSGQTSFLPPDYGPLFGGAKKMTAAKRSNRRPKGK